ncbi:hypothetical protein TEA_022462 [Camellia sinensis var. sinensis]|uniref:Leucine-rich repeat-containing N-terminal plant-type domain-containing protein n=2 Tax=Camellia sinensis TaxID=4442 RepID=A0A4S4E0T9_CAMSN|nr:hypothetical protein TEA_022462 [Camellia sinensis var. sinensis]
MTQDEKTKLRRPFVVMEAHRVQLKVALLLLLINSVLTQQVVRLSSRSEFSALLDLRSSLGIRAKDWPRKTDPCSRWRGVECRTGQVVGITLSGLRRTPAGGRNPGFAVDSLANFTLLAKFNSYGFPLPGSIPDWFGQRLSALQVLDLSSCSITGSIPSSLGILSGLNSLYLSDNFLTGAIPLILGQLLSLSVLNLSRNSFTGTIPSGFSSLLNLSTLDLSSNFLFGPIPNNLGSLSRLKFLHLQNNSFDASIPVELASLSQLIVLDLGHNGLSGSLPNGLFSNLTQLQYVVLSRNSFDGNLPDVLSSLPALRLLNVSSNKFTGVLPNLTAFFNATGAVVDLSDNYFQGPAPSNTGTNVVVNGNCLQSLPNQRSLQDCRSFYASRGLIFGNDIAPNPSLEPASISEKRVTYRLVGLFGGLGFIVLLY